MRKLPFLFMVLFSSNTYAVTDYEFCKMLGESGNPNETVEYIGESYLEGKKVKETAMLALKSAIAKAVVDASMAGMMGANGAFLPQCLKQLKELKGSFMFAE